MMLTLMDQQVFIPTLLTIVISFDKITVSDGWQQVMTRICLDTIITSWHNSMERGGGGTVGHSHFDIIIQCRPVVM